jgi:hypothetical protein
MRAELVIGSLVVDHSVTQRSSSLLAGVYLDRVSIYHPALVVVQSVFDAPFNRRFKSWGNSSSSRNRLCLFFESVE